MPKTNTWLSGLTRYISHNGEALSAAALKRHLRWQLRHRMHILGWPGMVALGLLVMAPLLYFSAIRPVQNRLESAQLRIAKVQEQILNAGKAARAGGDTPREQLATFYKFFPGEKNAPEWLDKLVTVAEENGLSLDEGEYKVTQDKTGQLLRYGITLPVQGKYPQIRKFIASLPTELPPITLENVQLQRKDIVDSTVQVKIRLVLYLVQAS